MRTIKLFSKISKSLFICIPLIVLLMSSCEVNYYGKPGREGRAFLAVTWNYSEPEYLDIGTGAVPRVFEWGRYYPASAGYYTLYYEGHIQNGQQISSYAWEADYEIWRNPGEPAGNYYDGADGRDNYFTLECSPYGPYIYQDNYKKREINSKYLLLEESEEKIVVLQKSGYFTMKVTYTKVKAGRSEK
jgi:hypothetical protein